MTFPEDFTFPEDIYIAYRVGQTLAVYSRLGVVMLMQMRAARGQYTYRDDTQAVFDFMAEKSAWTTDRRDGKMDADD